MAYSFPMNLSRIQNADFPAFPSNHFSSKNKELSANETNLQANLTINTVDLNKVNKAFKNFSVCFKIDQKSHRVIIKVVDSETGDLIRQIPSEALLKINAALETGKISRGQLLNTAD